MGKVSKPLKILVTDTPQELTHLNTRQSISAV
jgi:hypothetical protein